MSSIQVAGPPLKGVSMSGCRMCQISDQHSLTGRPMALGCLVPRIGRYASLYIETYSGPHHSSSGKRLASRKFTIMRRLWDQPLIGPMGVLAQSMERMRAPVSPPSTRKGSAKAGCSGMPSELLSPPDCMSISRRNLLAPTAPHLIDKPQKLWKVPINAVALAEVCSIGGPVTSI